MFIFTESAGWQPFHKPSNPPVSAGVRTLHREWIAQRNDSIKIWNETVRNARAYGRMLEFQERPFLTPQY